LHLALLAAPCGLYAQAPQKSPEVRLSPVTVSATRIEQATEDVAATVSVIDEAEREKTLAGDIRDLIKYEPGVSVRNAPARFSAAGPNTGRDGNAGFNIRGIEGNNILIQADGVRLPLAFSFGAINYGRGDYLDLEAYKSVEVLRGPASTLYGSDGLAGAVSFTTKDPADYLARGKSLYLGAKAGYAEADRSHLLSATLAARAGRIESLLLLSQRSGAETRNKGENDSANSTRTRANPQNIDSDYLLGKLIFSVAPGHSLKLTGERFRRDVATDVLTGRAPPPLVATSVIDLKSDDRLERDRLSLAYTYTPAASPWLRKAELSLYRQNVTNLQLNAEDRFTAADRRRDNTYAEDLDGAALALQSQFDSAGLVHRVAWGADGSKSRFVGIRDGVTPPVGETFPTKPFPDTDYSLFGAYLQDEMLWGDRFSLIPALRYDRYRIAPRQGDPLYPSSANPPTLADSKITPKLGVVLRFAGGISAFVQAAQGFRAPTPSQVNNGFENRIANYVSIANPDLRPETSNAIEIGLRGRGSGWSFDLAAFEGRYKDFISQIQVRGNFTPTNPAVFQFVNLSRVRIRGLEGRAQWRSQQGYGVFGNFAYARGDDTALQQPLESIDPLKVVLGAEYVRAAWGVQAVAQIIRAKEASRVLSPAQRGGTAAFLSPSATVLDLQAFYRLGPATQINLAVNNLTDRKYWVWADVRGQSATSAVLDGFTQSGRNVALTLKASFQ
jgi:hemoglobin/transferrin/lactoferrin receptor protein